MKATLAYGFLMALGGAVLTLVLYFAGFHDDLEKMSTAKWVGGVGGLAITVACLSFAMRDKRANAPADENWGYGSAFGTGVLTALWGALFGALFAYVYFGFINPGFSEVMLQGQLAKLEASGKLSAAQIANAEPLMRRFASPPVLVAFQAVFGFIWTLILSLIVAIFFRERRVAAGVPPPIG
jgi:hypothetical protein